MLDLVFHRGLLSGRHYALSLLRPGHVMSKPRCPYWCPLRVLVWRLGFSLGAFHVLYKR
jgi:hypothetical protein